MAKVVRSKKAGFPNWELTEEGREGPSALDAYLAGAFMRRRETNAAWDFKIASTTHFD